MYAKCGSLDECRNVFVGMQELTVVSWNALILGYADNGEGEVALELFSRMQGDGYEANSRTLVAAFKAIALKRNASSRARGKALHLLAMQNSWEFSVYAGNTLLALYARCGSMPDAIETFSLVTSRDVVSWNVLILGYAENGEGDTALDLMSRMRDEAFAADSRTFIAAFKACSEIATRAGGENALGRGKALHSLAVQQSEIDIYVKSTLIDMYSKCGCMEEAMKVFTSAKHPDLVSWNALILGYVDNQDGEMALVLFTRMRREACPPDSITFVAALKACSDLALHGKPALPTGKAIHLLALCSGTMDMYVKSTLVDMYAKCREMQNAQVVFDGMEHWDVVAWTALIVGYADCGEIESALSMFLRMRLVGCAPNARTFVAALKACTAKAALAGASTAAKSGKALHLLASSSGSDASFYVGSSLIDMYSKLGSMDEAHKVFETLKHSDVVCWTALISGYAENEQGAVVLELFECMKRSGVEADPFALAAALKACTMLGALEQGKAIHAEIRNRGLDTDLFLVNCLVVLYAKCGSMLEAEQVFRSHEIKDLVTWSALMTGYSRCGDAEAVFDLFDRMVNADVRPDRITFLCLLTACSHAGLVDKGRGYLALMSRHGTTPDLEHYTCLTDILGRANKLDDAMALLRCMPFSPDYVTWMTVLGACCKRKNAGLGRLVFESLKSLDPKDSGAYVLMSGMCK